MKNTTPKRAEMLEALTQIANYILPVYTDEQGRARVPVENAEHLRNVARKALHIEA